jgi:hypothetical protein
VLIHHPSTPPTRSAAAASLIAVSSVGTRHGVAGPAASVEHHVDHGRSIDETTALLT